MPIRIMEVAPDCYYYCYYCYYYCYYWRMRILGWLFPRIASRRP